MRTRECFGQWGWWGAEGRSQGLKEADGWVGSADGEEHSLGRRKGWTKKAMYLGKYKFPRVQQWTEGAGELYG